MTDRAAAQHAGGEQGAAGADQHRLEAGERGDRVALVLARVRDGDGQEREPGGGEPEAEPLAAVEPVTEVALGREGDQHQAPRDHGLDQRQRGDRHRGDVEHPGDRGDREAHRPPSGPKQGREALQGAPEPDLRRLAGAAMLEEHREVRHCRARQCQRYAKCCHSLSNRREAERA